MGNRVLINSGNSGRSSDCGDGFWGYKPLAQLDIASLERHHKNLQKSLL